MTNKISFCLFYTSVVPSVLTVIGPHFRCPLGYGAGAAFFLIIAPFGDFIMDYICETSEKAHDCRHKFSGFPGVTASSRFLLYSQLSVYICSLLYSIIAVSRDPSICPATTVDCILYTVSVGTVAGLASLSAHELSHGIERGLKRDVLIGDLIMSAVLNPVYNVEHRYHHRDVGTKWDPSTARYRESFYCFLMRRQVNSWNRAFSESLSKYRCSKSLPVIVARDRFAAGTLRGFLMFLTIFCTLGASNAVFYVLSCSWGAVMLSMGDYVQHYGVKRFEDPKTGKLEPVSRRHSWDNRHFFSSLLLCSAGGHAHHHTDPSVSFLDLQRETGPTLPYGLIAMGVLALFPEMFFAVTDCAVEQAGFLKTDRKV